ncbi:MAG: type IV pilus assembly protein PilM [Candidatus Pacebacteria bacterium]|nr:type IV pilus assembly protein PilM [Candidatus Paceibacterota bacterium]
MFNVFSPRIDVFALDISDLFLKVVQLNMAKKHLPRFAYGQLEIPEGLVTRGEIRNEDEFARLIKQAVARPEQGKIRAKYAAVSLPEEKSFVDVLRLPDLKKEEIKQAVIFEAANYIPVPLDEVYLGFEIIDCPQNVSRGECVEVLIAATPRKIVDGYARSLRLAGFRPFLMEVESLSLARALVKQNIKHRPLLIIDFGQSRTGFAIFAGSSLRFTSTIPVSSKEISSLLASQLKISVREAEQIRQTEGLWGNQKTLDAIVPALTDLTEQIKKHLDYYHSHNLSADATKTPQRVEKILLCGSGASLKGLASFLADSLKIKVELGNPWVNIFPPSSKEVLPITLEKSLNYAAALGLALGASSYYD